MLLNYNGLNLKKWVSILLLGYVLLAANAIAAKETDTPRATANPQGPLLKEPSWSKTGTLGKGALSDRLASMLEAANNPFSLIPYGQNYFLYTYATEINREMYKQAGFDGAGDLVDHEAKFQLSIVFPLWRNILGEGTVLAASYTQLSLWQATNSNISAPFRETNYEPQIFINLAQDSELFRFRLNAIDIGFNHQSNGRSEPLSRSWNRIFANFSFERGDLAVLFNPYIRLQEDQEDDDNPDIEDYLGNFKLNLAYRHRDTVYTTASRFSFSGGKGSIEAGISHPLTQNTRIYLQLFSGYGETLADYDFEQSRIGIGIMLNDLL